MTRTKHAPRRLQSAAPMREQYEKNHTMRGKREEPSKTHRNGGMIRLLVSALLLVTVIGVKLTAPDVVEKYRGKVLNLMGENTDFAEVFSAVGRAIGEEKITEVFRDVYVSVFGEDMIKDEPENTSVTDRNAVIYNTENTPQQADMFQRVLGFDYGDPVSGTLSSAFGYRDHPVEQDEKFHYGLDFAAEAGAIIRAFADGKVTAVGESSDLGKYVELQHENGYSTIYAHCSKVTASSGQTVRLGDPIAEVGETGEATGPHLHFALCQDTLYLNPIYYVTL